MIFDVDGKYREDKRIDFYKRKVSIHCLSLFESYDDREQNK